MRDSIFLVRNYIVHNTYIYVDARCFYARYVVCACCVYAVCVRSCVHVETRERDAHRCRFKRGAHENASTSSHHQRRCCVVVSSLSHLCRPAAPRRLGLSSGLRLCMDADGHVVSFLARCLVEQTLCVCVELASYYFARLTPRRNLLHAPKTTRSRYKHSTVSQHRQPASSAAAAASHHVAFNQ